MTPRVAWLHVAPIKSLRIQERTRVTLTPRGVDEDRRFCIVDAEDRMLNAKRVAAFIAVRPEFDEAMTELALHMPDGTTVRGPVEIGAPVTVSIYRRSVPAREVRGPFARALSGLDGRPARLVRFDDPGEGVDRAAKGGAVSLLSAASLDALSEAATADGPVDPRRFRMLIGIAGVPAHAEDGWIGRPVRVGSAVVVPEGNVGRCAVTTLDPERGVSDLDTLGALARYRGAQATTESLPFGVWARVERPGVVAVGDDVAV
ncbi:MAG TPA: MOSC N-terminal beta barrel domain-containing protein [Candidatus Limnocylindria bacterium]|nr:MOSC N-terminal beta barrel domain-containing protein [Candidatus Limnocylindria bacterium]